MMLLLLFFLITNALAEDAATWPRVLLPTATGALALDGTPAALYLRPGVGANKSNIILFWEGGGWCESLEDCVSRSKTALGSSTFLTAGYSARDVLSPNCTLNPYFCDWSMVYAQYLDGTSRSGNVEAPVVVGNSTIYFRGHRIREATIDALLSPSGPGAGLPSLSAAPRLLVTGSSAGGLTSILHIDEIARAVRAVNPSCDVRVVPEVGFFLDGQDIWDKRIMTSVFTRVAAFSNVSGGAPEQVNAACALSKPADKRWQCFMAQYTLPHLTTPSFVVNSMVDEWQAENVLAPDLDYASTVRTYPPFKPCIAAPTVTASASCNATQARQWVGYGQQFLAGLEAARSAVPAPVAAVSGGVITSCPIHTTLIGGLSHRIRVQGRTLYECVFFAKFSRPTSQPPLPALHAPPPLFQRRHITNFMDGGSGWTIDSAYPSNPTCPKPAEVLRIE